MPSRCQVCGRWPAQPVCTACVARFGGAVPRCDCCAIALPLQTGTATRCAHCLRNPLPLHRCWAVVDYAYPWHTVVTRFKFQQQPAWARSMARLAHERRELRDALQAADGVLPIPLSTQRLAERGYNQAWELVKALQPRHPRPDTLLRLEDTVHQTGQNRQARQHQMRNAFCVAPAHLQAVRGQHLLVVDDVMTTGATLCAAAEALLRAGAAGVSGLCFARTPAPD